MSCVVDTDWIIIGLHGRPQALDALEERRDEGLGVSIVTLVDGSDTGRLRALCMLSRSPSPVLLRFHRSE